MDAADAEGAGSDTGVAVYFAGGAGDGKFGHVDPDKVDSGQLEQDGATYHSTTREVLTREGTWQIWEHDGPADAP